MFQAFSRWVGAPGPNNALSVQLVFLSLVIGCATGACVAAIQGLVIVIQRATLGFAAERRVAIPDHSSWLRIALVLVIGAVLVSVATAVARRWTTKNPSDAVEANALRGGVMTWADGVLVVIPILFSVGFGASVGIEAAVTQIGAVLASTLGRRMRMPRSDLRLLVGTGAAAAISAAYQAPIAGMLYAYELILGSYTKRTLVPVALAALSSLAVVSLLHGGPQPFGLKAGTDTWWTDYPLAVFIGFVAALVGIGTMILVGAVERLLSWLFVSELTRRVAAACVLALLALRYPAVLGSGHAAIDAAVNGGVDQRHALGLLGAKGIASATSLGGGFRGGLFSASLLIGALLGQVIAWALNYVPGAPLAHPALCALIGMAAVGACIIGSPLAMAFLVLESTGDYDALLVVAIGTITSAYVADRLFGYSFATWRFQQRGLAIEGGHDISRLNVVPITSLIRAPKYVLPSGASLAQVARAVSAAGSKAVAVRAPDGSFLGLIDPALLEAIDEEEGPLPIAAADLVAEASPRLTPKVSLAEVVTIFRREDSTALAVVDETNSHILVGTVRSSDAFRLAASVVDAQRREDLGLGPAM